MTGSARLAFVHILRVDTAGHRQGPESSAYREAARTAVCGSNVRQLMLGFVTYAAGTQVVGTFNGITNVTLLECMASRNGQEVYSNQ